jgi:hypothetical protein
MIQPISRSPPVKNQIVPVNCNEERLQHSHVVGDPVVRVVSAHLLTQDCMLLADRNRRDRY